MRTLAEQLTLEFGKGFNHINIKEFQSPQTSLQPPDDFEVFAEDFLRFISYQREMLVMFNIRGNRYRLIAMVFFDIRTIFIRFVGTHAEYDKVDVTTI